MLLYKVHRIFYGQKCLRQKAKIGQIWKLVLQVAFLESVL
jgi:hypothetical protein